MALLDQLIGGGELERDYLDFVNRYDQGAPYDRISDEEAAGRYRQVVGEMDRDTRRAMRWRTWATTSGRTTRSSSARSSASGR